MKLITNLDEGDVEFFKKQYLNLGEINNTIETLENEKPEEGSENYLLWKNKVNFLIDLYNKNAHYKSFKRYE